MGSMTQVEHEGEPLALARVEVGPGTLDAVPEAAQQLSYAGAGTLTLTMHQRDTLVKPFDDEAYEIKPTGEVYVSQVHYRRRLNDVFGPGAWALVPRSGWINQGDTICREYALYVRGVFVAEAIGETDYQPSNDRMSYASAAEGARSSALTRCCKDLGIASECWSRRWANTWREEHCVEVWRGGSKRPQWRLKDAQPFHDETGVVVAGGRPSGGSSGGSDHGSARTSRPEESNGPACPQCGKAGRASKYAKPGASHYCPTCKVKGAKGDDVALTFAGHEPEREPGSDDGEPTASATNAPAPDAGSVPVLTSKPACAACGHGRSVICKPDGAWSCSSAKGGCGAILGRVK